MENNETVFIVNHEPETCSSVSWLLESIGLTTKTFHSGRQFLDNCDENTCGCAVIDMHMPEMDGLELQTQMRNHSVNLPIIFLSGQNDAPISVKALKNGAMDFLLKPFNAQVLLSTVQQGLKKSSSYHSIRKRQSLIKRLLKTLTPRENQVMELVITGMRSKQIAQELSITIKTVELYRARIMEKLQVESSVALTHKILSYRHAMEHQLQSVVE
ncbi:MAG: response regulator [Gammaproteobacteria bacterium]|nr:response regulator [Gammaproteobacteria bacterium]MCH9744891.1 response regulator [Gammaproteobacteria bacterium]